MKREGPSFWITHTASAVALLIIVQVVTTSLGSTLITGSCVNLILILSVMTGGLRVGLWVAVLSPVAARLMGIGPLWSLIPFIAIGNAALSYTWYCYMKKNSINDKRSCIKAAIIAAVVKTLVLYIGIVKFAVPFILTLPEKQAVVISQMFSAPQLVTALIGGGMATAALPAVYKVIVRE